MLMHPAHGGEVLQHALIDLYGEPIPVVVDNTATTIPLDKVRECIAAAPHLTSPHMDGWRMEHLEILSRDDAFATALAAFISNIATGDVPATTADYLASTTRKTYMYSGSCSDRTSFFPYSPTGNGLCFCEAGMQLCSVGHQGRHRGSNRPKIVCSGVQGGMRIPTVGLTCCDGGRPGVRPDRHGCHQWIQ